MTDTLTSINADASPDGFKQTEIGLIPEEWDSITLDDENFFEFSNGLWKGEKKPFVRARVIRNTNFNNNGTIDYSDVAELEIEQRAFGKKQLKQGDIIIERSGGGPKQPVGRVVYFDRDDDDFSFSNFTSCLRTKTPETVQSKFLLYYLLNFHMQGKTESLQKRTTGIRNLDFGDYKKTAVPFPPLPEQRAIAHVLSKIQAAAQAQAAIAKRARELKRALMAKLFTEGLHGEPLKETEIGPMPESWRTIRLGEISKIGNGSTPKRTEAKYWEGGTIPWLTSSKVYDGTILHADEFVTEAARRECHLPTVAKGSVVVAITGQGKTLGNSALLAIDTCVSQHLTYITFHSLGVIAEFVLVYLRSRYEYFQMISRAGGSTKGALTCGFLKGVVIPLPETDEQREIARALQTVDAKITAAERKRAGLEELFRALLGELMTGRVRTTALSLSC